jgi:hypothetical protein
MDTAEAVLNGSKILIEDPVEPIIFVHIVFVPLKWRAKYYFLDTTTIFYVSTTVH